MTEQSDKKPDFVREQICRKPVNRKKLGMNALNAAVCGVVFALAALLVFGAASLVSAARKNHQRQQENISLPEETESEEILPETETEEEVQPQETVIVNEVSLSLEDYRKLQNELYNIGRSAASSMVSIVSTASSSDWFNREFDTHGSGTGMVIADSGEAYLILTEKSAIGDGSRISVTFSDGTDAEASMKSYDTITGIAVIAVEKSSLPADTTAAVTVAELGNSRFLSNGQLAVAVGRPLAAAGSILTGMITSGSMEIPEADNNYTIITTNMLGDTSSGGFLLNTDGQIVGMILQNLRSSELGNMIAAVGITDVKPLINQLMNGHQMGYAGIYVSTVTDEIASEYSLPAGVYVREVAVDSPAMEAGLQSGDVITAVNGEAFTTVSGWYSRLVTLAPSDTCTITLQRQGQDGYHEVELDLTMGVCPQ